MEKRDYSNIPEAQECAIWKRYSKNGKEYLSGIVKINGKEFKIVAFQNEKEEGSKKPDYSFRQKNDKEF